MPYDSFKFLIKLCLYASYICIHIFINIFSGLIDRRASRKYELHIRHYKIRILYYIRIGVIYVAPEILRAEKPVCNAAQAVSLFNDICALCHSVSGHVIYELSAYGTVSPYGKLPYGLELCSCLQYRNGLAVLVFKLFCVLLVTVAVYHGVNAAGAGYHCLGGPFFSDPRAAEMPHEYHILCSLGPRLIRCRLYGLVKRLSRIILRKSVYVFA